MKSPLEIYKEQLDKAIKKKDSEKKIYWQERINQLKK